MAVMYDKAWMKKVAEELENFLEMTEKYIIIEGLTPEEEAEARESVRKLIDKLNKGKGKKVFDPDRYDELVNGPRPSHPTLREAMYGDGD